MPNRRRNSADRLRLALAVLFVGAVIMATGVLIGHHLNVRSSAPATTPPPSPTAVVSPRLPSVNPPSTTASNEFASLAADFAQLENELQAQIGVAVSAIGSRASPSMLGGWQDGPAWSTIKVPLAIAALTEQRPHEVTDAMRAAITESDNAAAESIWASLGDPVTAAGEVEKVLGQAGDGTVVEYRKLRPEYTAFGQTDWPLAEQARYLAFAACDDTSQPILDLMGQVDADQAWGLGKIPDTRFKGGWGPDLSGNYLVRQIGLMQTPNGMIAVAIAAQPKSGSFADGTRDLNEVADWLNAHLAALPVGQCGH